MISHSIRVLWLAAAVLAVPAAGAAPVTPLRAADSVYTDVEPFAYRIVPGDELMVDFGVVLDGKPVNAPALVRPDGVISLPRIGDVRAAGRTTAEMDSLLSRLYAGVYLNPTITVAVTRLASNLVHVLGDVRAPGSYPIVPNASALQAIAQAGGFQVGASRGSVLVLRRTGPEQVTVRKVDTTKLLSDRKSAGDMLLRRNDIVYVNRGAIGNMRVFAENVLQPLIAGAETYIRGWTIAHMREVYLGRDRIVLP